MMPNLPIFGTTLCERDGEFEGWTIEFTWGRLRLGFTIVWRDASRA